MRLTTPEALVAWSAPRYRFVTKTFDGFSAPGAVVCCHGMLAGEWPHGTPFADLRFLDRFAPCCGRILRLDVWNDLAEARGAEARGA